MKAVLPYRGWSLVDLQDVFVQPLAESARQILPYVVQTSILLLFALLFCWVSVGFWTALMGFFQLLRGKDRYSISASSPGNEPIPAEARTALVMPIANEDVPRVFAGLRATYESLKATGELEHFDIFVLSDSNDPDTCVAEQQAWVELCRAVDGFGHIFYRRRRRRVKRKSGNIDDFCRRWGSSYRYMVVLDADSVMSGECLTSLVRLMEANPNAGIIQTAPRPRAWTPSMRACSSSLHASTGRCSPPGSISGSWASRTTGVTTRSSGQTLHRALRPGAAARHRLLRRRDPLARFRRGGADATCRLGRVDRLRSAGQLRRAAAQPARRAQARPPLVPWQPDELPSVHGARRAHGASSGVSDRGDVLPVGAAVVPLPAAVHRPAGHPYADGTEYFLQPNQLYPLWPRWHPEEAIALFSATMTLLFLPKLLSVLLVCIRGAQAYGGRLRVVLSMLIETLFSVLLAPVRMLFHSVFVTAAFLGWSVQWKSPQRGDDATPGEALRRHGSQIVIGVLWTALVAWLDAAFLWWLAPIVVSLILRRRCR